MQAARPAAASRQVPRRAKGPLAPRGLMPPTCISISRPFIPRLSTPLHPIHCACHYGLCYSTPLWEPSLYLAHATPKFSLHVPSFNQLHSEKAPAAAGRCSAAPGSCCARFMPMPFLCIATQSCTTRPSSHPSQPLQKSAVPRRLPGPLQSQLCVRHSPVANVSLVATHVIVATLPAIHVDGQHPLSGPCCPTGVHVPTSPPLTPSECLPPSNHPPLPA